MTQDSEGLDLAQTLGALRRRAPLILLCLVLAAGAALGFSEHETKKYTATASLSFSNNQLSQQIAGVSAGSASNNVLVQQANNRELVRLGDMAAKTAAQLGHGLTAQKVTAGLSISGEGESNVVNVSSETSSPTLSAAIANTYAKQFVAEQQSNNSNYYKSALALVRKQLAALTPRQRVGADGLQLQNRLQTLNLLTALDYGNVLVAQEALAPSSPTSPKTSRNTLLGGVLGLLIGLGLAFVLERLDRRIKDPEDLHAVYRLPVLGVVSESAALTGVKRGKGGGSSALPAAEAEAFSLIRAHLRFFNIDRDLQTLVVASPGPGDGKTTIARHLAEASARAGARVLLLEADLRQPTLSQQLELEDGPGLADVLIGAIPAGEATRSVKLDPPPGVGATGRSLDVLSAGSLLPPNPAELLESHAMSALLEQAKSAYDLVVIDTPPLAAVADAFPLLRKVDGVILVAWLTRSRRDVAEQLQQVLESSGAPLLGVIANGAGSTGPSRYPYVSSRASAAAASTPASSSASATAASPLSNGNGNGNGNGTAPEPLVPTIES
jgi:capsular exopolysaccharide synthesis family protein